MIHRIRMWLWERKQRGLESDLRAPSPAPAAPTFEPWTVDDPHATEIYQDEKILRYKNGNGRVVFFNKEAFKFLRDTSPAERANADMPFTRTGVDAPAPFAPDREALSRLFYKTWRQRPPGVGFNARELADAYIDYFAPLLAERDALRQRAEDAEMIVKANADRDGNWYFERLRSGKWRLNNYGDTHHDDVEIDLETNPATGLPILTAEARIALGRKT